MTKMRYLSASTMFLLAGLILFSYTALNVIPIFGTYLGSDRITYSLYIMGASLMGFIIYWLGRRNNMAKFLKYIFYIFALILIVVFPLAVTVRSASSFRGFGWSLETFLIGLVPVLILICGFLIWSGRKRIALVSCVIYGFLALFHLVALVKIFPRLSRAFSTHGSSDLIIGLIIILFTSLCAWINFSYYRMKK